ncbi:hypothetical protein GTR04_4879 [Trichophyton interdigitale]|nr:hypothetical protein GY631_4712 [Trichophyton interdigitale]KAG5219028.1 hypothetical protein GY632_4970 [Trichophyton interdigitale]KAG8207739.1 hypothetical protein GTR04_4879 [Trichophyton interdigitale]
MRLPSLPLLVWLAAAAATSAGSCSHGYIACHPKGAGSGDPPDIGPDMVTFYAEMLGSVKGHGSSHDGHEKRSLNENHGVIARRGSEGELCCKGPGSGIECLLLDDNGVPFCWDPFTTNFFFKDGSHGNAVSGEYQTGDGGRVNLIQGNFTQPDGTQGNIYSGKDSAPNTSTLPVPMPYTSAGVGSPIPGNKLGNAATPDTTAPSTSTAKSPSGAKQTASADSSSQRMELGFSLVAAMAVLACALLL